MIDRDKIIETYDRLEKEAGGYAAPGGDAQTVARKTAEALGITYERVRDVMIDHWIVGAGG